MRWFARRRPRQQWLLVNVAFWLGVSRLAVLTLPHARLERWFGDRLGETPDEASDPALADARAVARAVHRVSDHTPWTSNCLPQAMTASRLLRRRGVPTTIYIGARFRDDSPKLMAHAWCRCGPLYVTGGDGSQSFGAIVSYASQPGSVSARASAGPIQKAGVD